MFCSLCLEDKISLFICHIPFFFCRFLGGIETYIDIEDLYNKGEYHNGYEDIGRGKVFNEQEE